MAIPTPGDQEAIRPIVLQGQIIIGALLAGLLCFLVIVNVIDLGPPPGVAAAAAGAGAVDRAMPIITYMAVAFAAISLPLSTIVPLVITNQQRRAIAAGKSTGSAVRRKRWRPIGRQPDPTHRLARGLFDPAHHRCRHQRRGRVLRSGRVSIEKNPIAIAVAVVLIAGVATRIPTPGRVERWLEQQQKLRAASSTRATRRSHSGSSAGRAAGESARAFEPAYPRLHRRPVALEHRSPGATFVHPQGAAPRRTGGDLQPGRICPISQRHTISVDSVGGCGFL